MLRICRECGQEKEIEKFVKTKNGYRYKCKECKNAKRRTGKPNTGRFKKGTVSPRKGKSIDVNGKRGLRSKKWVKAVKERDGKCMECGMTEKLHAHHIVPWNDNEELRFDLDNGVTLCGTCHGKLEGFRKGESSWNKGKIGGIGWNKGVARSEETKKKISESKKGQIPWNKGVKGQTAWNKGMKSPGKVNSGSFKKDQIPWNKGIPVPEERKKRISKSLKERGDKIW